MISPSQFRMSRCNNVDVRVREGEEGVRGTKLTSTTMHLMESLPAGRHIPAWHWVSNYWNVGCKKQDTFQKPVKGPDSGCAIRRSSRWPLNLFAARFGAEMEAIFVLITRGDFRDPLQAGNDFVQMRLERAVLRPRPKQRHCRLFVHHSYCIASAMPALA